MKKSIFCIVIALMLSLSVVACGKPTNKFSITFDGNGGATADGETQVVIEISEGKSFISPTFIYEGYEFIGWDVDNLNNLKTDTTVKALWQKKINVVVVRFDLDGGTLVDGVLTQEVEKGGNAVAPTVEKYGYDLVGYDVSLENVTEDVVITAIWKAHGTLIEFNSNGGTHCNIIEVTFGKPLPTLPTPTWIPSEVLFGEEYTFIGWYYVDAENNEVKISSGDIWQYDVSQITFKAKWKPAFTDDNV